eukprot:scaffold45947_cov29-Tisochrysis_lutea.AAC.3
MLLFGVAPAAIVCAPGARAQCSVVEDRENTRSGGTELGELVRMARKTYANAGTSDSWLCQKLPKSKVAAIAPVGEARGRSRESGGGGLHGDQSQD